MKKLFLVAMIVCGFTQVFAQAHRTENVVIVTLDGMRWQEVFRGADSALINSKYTEHARDVKRDYWADAANDRRQKLMPFIWSELVANGQLYGNRDQGSTDQVNNPYHISYPGYNELFTGFADPRINSNNALNNPNTNVLEFLSKQKGFENKVAVFASWERFPQIMNVQRSGLMVNAGYMKPGMPGLDAKMKYLEELQTETPRYLGDSTRIDFLTFEFGKQYLMQYKPRVLYLAFDETDEMAHSGNYRFYLDRAHQEDNYIKQLWQYLQTDPTYKNKTTLVVTCDHGRGDALAVNWRSHGVSVEHSDQTWFAIIGPDTRADGEMKNNAPTFHDQIAQTLAILLGFDFKAATAHPVGNAINSVFRQQEIKNISNLTK